MSDRDKGVHSHTPRAARIALYTVLILAALIYLTPLYVIVVTSLKSLQEIHSGNLLALPLHPTLQAWKEAWSSACSGATCEGVQVYFWNSVHMVIPAVLISTAFGAINGYVLTKWTFRGSELFFTLLLVGTFVPFQMFLLPMAWVLGKIHLDNSIPGLVLVHVVYGLAFTTLFFHDRRRRLLHHLLAHHAAGVHAHLHGLHHLAVHADLERLPVRRGLHFRRVAPDHRCLEQPGQHLYRGAPLQRRDGRSHDRRPADLHRLPDCGQILRTRADRRFGQGLSRSALIIHSPLESRDAAIWASSASATYTSLSATTSKSSKASTSKPATISS
ncbi:MAG: carbohydrate ABC transporter permease [Acidihalobacter sp.]